MRYCTASGTSQDRGLGGIRAQNPPPSSQSNQLTLTYWAPNMFLGFRIEQRAESHDSARFRAIQKHFFSFLGGKPGVCARFVRVWQTPPRAHGGVWDSHCRAQNFCTKLRLNGGRFAKRSSHATEQIPWHVARRRAKWFEDDSDLMTRFANRCCFSVVRRRGAISSRSGPRAPSNRISAMARCLCRPKVPQLLEEAARRRASPSTTSGATGRLLFIVVARVSLSCPHDG